MNKRKVWVKAAQAKEGSLRYPYDEGPSEKLLVVQNPSQTWC